MKTTLICCVMAMLSLNLEVCNGATITKGDLPDSTPLLDSSDPFGFGYGFSVNGVTYYWTNQPSITVTVAAVGTDEVARAMAAYAYSPTNQPFALTNVLISADRNTNGWWTFYIITNGVRSRMQ